MEQREVEIVESEKPDTFPTIYCNQIRVVMSQWDMTLDVGQADFTKAVDTKSGKKSLPVQLKARIIMSPQHAKAFAQMLTQQVKKYESDFGELAIQPKQEK